MAAFRKVRPGDPLIIPAAAFNAFIDAAQRFQEQQHNTEQDPYWEQRHTGIVLVRNDSGADRQRFDILGIGGPVIRRVDNPDSFKNQIAIKGVTPTATHAGRFVVLLEPVKAGSFARGCVHGVCLARVRMNREDDGFAEVKENQISRLESGGAGSAALLWVEPVGEREYSDTAWAIIRLGNRGGIQWARIVSVQASTFTARLMDNEGNEQGPLITVNVLGATSTGITATPTLSICSPRLTAGSIVRVTSMPAAGSNRPAGYWLADLVFETCT